MRYGAGALLAALVSIVALRARALSPSGAIAAFLVGTATFGAGGWQATLVLFAFFIPSTLLSRIGYARKRALVDVGKQGARDGRQVLANGGIAALAIVLSSKLGAPLSAAFAGALAAASADTWGTEIGTLAKGAPRSILTLAPIPAGLSGGVTLQGSIAEVAGAALVAASATLCGVAPFVPVFAAGVAGAFIDSLVGAGAQALRWCPSCVRACETDPHVCGTPTVIHRGAAWLENDAVNLIATLSGAALAFAVVLL